MTRRASLTGISTRTPGVGVTQYYAESSFPPLPAGSIRGAFFKPSDPLHPSLHKFRSIERALLFGNTAVALVFAAFLLFARF